MSSQSPTVQLNETSPQHSSKPSVTSPQFTLNPFQLLGSWLSVFQSLPLAIVLLSLLAIGVMVGVFLPQIGLTEVADIKAQYGSNYRMMKAMGFFTVYSSPWFIALEVLFFFNLLFGSFQWLRPAFRAATLRTFCAPEHILASPNRCELSTPQPMADVTKILAHQLKQRGYTKHIKRGKNGLVQWYAHKGDLGRLGPVAAHFGILLMLLSSVYGVFTGFRGQQMMTPGETASFLTLDKITTNIEKPYWIGSTPDWQLKLHDFKIDYYASDPTTPKQYTSDLELLDQAGHSLARQDVSVNHPLSYGGVMFYQASFAPTGNLFLTVNGKPLKAAINTTFQDRPIALTPIGEANDNQSLMIFPFFVKQDAGVEKNNVRVFLHEGDHLWGAKSGKMPPNLTLYEGDVKTLGPVTVSYEGPEMATGFQIKKAPETPWIYLAFLIISVGAAMCFLTQQQVWVAIQPADDSEENASTKILMTYKTNKAPVGFYHELTQLQEQLVADLGATVDRAVTAIPRKVKPKKRKGANDVA